LITFKLAIQAIHHHLREFPAGAHLGVARI